MSPFQRMLLLLLLAPALGCGSLSRWWHNGMKVGPDYGRPVVPVAPAWVDAAEDELVVQSEPVVDWWRVFNDPTLDHLVAAAYQQNLPLRAAALRVLEYRAQRNIAAANLFPQSQLAFGQYSRNQLSRTVANAFSGGPVRFNDLQTGFDLSWEIDIWGRLRRAIESADATLDSEIENYDHVLVTLIGDVAAAYIELRSFDERIRLAERNVEIQSGSLQIAKSREEFGRVSELDVHQALTNVADTRSLIPALRQGRRLAVNRLALLLGTSPYELEPILRERGQLPEAPTEAIVGIPADLIRRRPDVRDAERQVAAQSAQIGIAEAELYPQFAISGEIRVNSENGSDLFSTNSIAGFAAPGFRWKILNYGRLMNNVRVQELRFQQAIVQYENTVLSAQREVEDAIVQFLTSKERARELRISAEAAETSAELVREQYRLGRADFGRVFVLEASLVQAQDNLIANQAEVAITLTRIYKALGGGWQLRAQNAYSGRYAMETMTTSENESDAPSSEEVIGTSGTNEHLPPLPPEVPIELRDSLE